MFSANAKKDFCTVAREVLVFQASGTTRGVRGARRETSFTVISGM
jgi:hypothetical protein